ncbi:MAG: GTPase HflX [Dehalococcoidia bacterium]|nr:GTPase HflX [Dehalococcoidia bacterium]
MHETREPEKALLIGVRVKGRRYGWTLDDSLDELEQLAGTAGAEVVGRLSQHLVRPSSRFYMGEGKLSEATDLIQPLGYNLLICDDELSPIQGRNLELALGLKVLDRTALILDIFARRARTREGQLQVELAQHQYLLPRLAGRWPHLERLGAGIGTRGPGESQLETDRRLIRRRIHRLTLLLEDVRLQRSLHRQRRQREGLPVVSLVGYTNAGKSTLFNALCRSNAFIENKLFATLDPTTHRLHLPGGVAALASDTVGFIQKLPPSIIAAFRATLEDLKDSAVLVHVVDITHPLAPLQFRTVEETLSELGVSDKPRLMVLNKVDLLPGRQAKRTRLGDSVAVSALTGWGLEVLRRRIAASLK